MHGWRNYWTSRKAKLRERRKVKRSAQSINGGHLCRRVCRIYRPYMYSTYERRVRIHPTSREKIMVLGGGPNRIGQGIEFDYCCVHAALAMRDGGL